MNDPEFPRAFLEAHGPDLDALTVAEAIEVADRLRAIAAALPGSSCDVHVAGKLNESAELVERRAGIT